MNYPAALLHAAKSAVAVEVSSPELPTVLQEQIAAQLHHKWQETRLQAGQLTHHTDGPMSAFTI